MTAHAELNETKQTPGQPDDFALVFESYRFAEYSPGDRRAASERVYGYARSLTAAAVGIEFDDMLQADGETRETWFRVYNTVRSAMISGFYFGKVSGEGYLHG